VDIVSESASALAWLQEVGLQEQETEGHEECDPSYTWGVTQHDGGAGYEVKGDGEQQGKGLVITVWGVSLSLATRP
jgi:hypothetical protein